MNTLDELYASYAPDLDAVNDWSKQRYESHFAGFFYNQSQLFMRLSDRKCPISDSELESILIDVPLNLLAASEQLSKLRTEFEVLKIKIKEKAIQIEQQSNEKTQSARREAAANATLEDSILVTAYQSIIDRVEHQISMTRELIMGAKKVWDSRRRTDQGNPVSEVSKDTLPKYSPGTYIK